MGKRKRFGSGRPGGGFPHQAPGKIITSEQGKAYSGVAKETEENFVAWLTQSEISEEDFLALVDREDFYLTYFHNEDMALVILHEKNREVAMPLVWQRENGVDYESYRVDVSLLLLYVANICKNESSKEKITSFVKTELLENFAERC